MSETTDDAFVNSIVGEGTHFRGHLELAGLLRIDGDFSGSIRTAGRVLIGRNGRADCTIQAGTVVIGGILRGTIHSTEKVIVLSSALIIGDIYSPRLIVEDGVILDGTFVIRGVESKARTLEVDKPETPEWLDTANELKEVSGTASH
ncbi:MAG: polymer-forming cytoskeletal protein [Spirochaetaceae bacterium]